MRAVIKNKLIDQLNQAWNSTIENSPKDDYYNLFKREFKFEVHFDV